MLPPHRTKPVVKCYFRQVETFPILLLVSTRQCRSPKPLPDLCHEGRVDSLKVLLNYEIQSRIVHSTKMEHQLSKVVVYCKYFWPHSGGTVSQNLSCPKIS